MADSLEELEAHLNAPEEQPPEPEKDDYDGIEGLERLAAHVFRRNMQRYEPSKEDNQQADIALKAMKLFATLQGTSRLTGEEGDQTKVTQFQTILDGIQKNQKAKSE